MPKTEPWNSFHNIFEEIGRKPSPKEWEQYGIPEGTPWKKAIAIRLYRAIIEENAYHLLPKMAEYLEPPTKQVDINITDWRAQFEQLGVPFEIAVERLKDQLAITLNEDIKLLPQMVEDEFQANKSENSLERGTVETAPTEPRDREEPTPRRPNDETGRPEHHAGQAAGETPLDSAAETETPTGE